MTESKYSKDIIFDPPLTEVLMEEHDYVEINITTSKEMSLDWFVDELKKTPLWGRLVVCFDTEKNEK